MARPGLAVWRWVVVFLAAGLAQAAELSPEIRRKVDGVAFTRMPDGAAYVNMDTAMQAVFGDQLEVATDEGRQREPNPQIPSALDALAERVPEGGAIHLGAYGGDLDFRRVKNNVAISGGGNGTLRLGSGQKDIQLMFLGPTLSVERGADGMGTEPLRGLVALMCGGSLHIHSDVKDCAWIASVNGWARQAMTASARIDNCLFLWFSYNWPFTDYNAHFKLNDADWWWKNAQVHIDCKGGGEKTRMYLFIETNYGNPGTGVWLENCKGLALYHGSTERASSQGPGVYYLKNCEGVQLGLRRFFPGSRGGGAGACPSHDLTIEGGRSNVLHVLSGFANPYGASLVNSDAALQIWAASFDFETVGVDADGILRFCFTPECNAPETDADKSAAQDSAGKNAVRWVADRNKKSGLPDVPENVAGLKQLIVRGRDMWWPINAKREETFVFGKTDLTREPIQVARKLPPPPSIPATDAPTTFRPLYYTLEADFGKALLDAGADPSGKRPSDDAFAMVMYGMQAAEVEKLVKDVQAGNREAVDKLHPKAAEGEPKDRDGRVRRGPVHVPAGTFLLTRTLHFDAGNGSLVGVGPDKTVLRFQGDIIGIKQWQRGLMASFAVEGGRVGLAITGADHAANVGAFQKSYIAGENYYNITFRGQTFCGLHIGTDDPAVMGGAEFDQNKFVNLKFYNTGLYGIFMNNNMTDKWLCLGSEFVGQKQAGISIKYNNLIHGGLYSCRFENIDGPGIDFMGGNVATPEPYRPYVIMVDQCDFIECGNETQPCVDYGYGELTSFTRVKIETKNKTVKCGYVGSAQHYEDVNVDVRLADGGAAMVLRAVRHGATARANGHILRGVKASGPVAWVDDANSQNELYRQTWKTLGKDLTADGSVPLRWDVNPAAGPLAPPNGWVHPYLFYRCSFGDKTYAYALLNVDVVHNRVLKEINLSSLE